MSDPRTAGPDSARQDALQRLGLLDAPAEESFDRLTRLAVRMLDVPAAFVSLLDEDRDFYLSHCGFGEPLASTRQLTGETFCHYTIHSPGPLVIEDTRAHPVYRKVLTVESLGVAAYVGIPLRLQTGVVVGAFCAIDFQPRQWTARAIDFLTEMANSVMTEFELREAANTAEAEKRRHRDLVEGLDAIVWELDARDGRFTFVSRFAEGVLGYPVERWLDEPGFWRDRLVHPEDREWASALRASATEAGGSHEMVYRAISADGRVFWFHDRIQGIVDAGGRPRLLRGVMIDITARKAAEEHYQRLVATAPQAIYALDRDGAFSELNPAGERLLERSADELLGRLFRDVVAAQHQECAAGIFADIVSGAVESTESELYVARPSGEERLLHVSVVGIRRDGAVEGLHGIARDVTEERQREVQLRRVERLASVGTLIGGVAHELHNPLQAVHGYSELLLLSESRPERRQDLEIIRREADRMAKIVSNLRLIARQTQESESARSAVDIDEVVRHILTVRRYALETGNVAVRLDLAADLPPVLANRGEIEQVLLNLVVNAEQAMAEVSRERVLILRTRHTSDGAAVSVIDNGTGISPPHLEHIFDPFFTTKPPGEGTGLGLSLANSIVGEHGGQLLVESELDRGTSFRVELPRAPVAEARPIREATLSASGAPLRILVVDDEPSIRRLLEIFLTQLGHRVESAAEGGEALRRIGETEYDLILSDLRMPGLSGEELFLQLQQRGDGLERRLIFVTGDAATSQAARLMAEVPLLVKPVHLEELARAVALATRERTSAPAAG